MISKVIGKINNNEVLFYKDSSGNWTAAVPSNLNGEYVTEIWVYDEAGNQAYTTRWLINIDLTQLKAEILPFAYTNAKQEDIFKFSAVELPASHEVIVL